MKLIPSLSLRTSNYPGIRSHGEAKHGRGPLSSDDDDGQKVKQASDFQPERASTHFLLWTFVLGMKWQLKYWHSSSQKREGGLFLDRFLKISFISLKT